MGDDLVLNPETDLDTDVTNLDTEFRHLPVVLYRYCKQLAKFNSQRDLAKANLKEVRAKAYKNIKSDPLVKHTEKSIESEIDLDQTVMEAQRKLIRAEHDASTWSGAVDSMCAKKDMLIQMGANFRKER